MPLTAPDFPPLSGRNLSAYFADHIHVHSTSKNIISPANLWMWSTSPAGLVGVSDELIFYSLRCENPSESYNLAWAFKVPQRQTPKMQFEPTPTTDGSPVLKQLISSREHLTYDYTYWVIRILWIMQRVVNNVICVQCKNLILMAQSRKNEDGNFEFPWIPFVLNLMSLAKCRVL